MKLLSIITVTRNNSSELYKTLHNVSNIINDECEHIIIDGASTDDTKEVIESKWPHFIRFYSEPDLGIYDAMNKGIRFSDAQWLLFLNAGDFLYETDFLGILELLKNSKSDYIFFRQFEENHYTKFSNRRFSMPTSHQAQVYKKSILAHNIYNISYRVGADYDLYKRLVNNINILASKSKLAITYVSPPGFSKNNEDVLKLDYSKIIKEHDGLVYFYIYRYMIGDLIPNFIKKIMPGFIRSIIRNALKL